MKQFGVVLLTIIYCLILVSDSSAQVRIRSSQINLADTFSFTGTVVVPRKVDPASPTAGELWINSSSTVIEYRDNGATPASRILVAEDTTQTLTGKTYSSPIFSGTVTGIYSLAGTPTLASALAFSGATINLGASAARGGTAFLTTLDATTVTGGTGTHSFSGSVGIGTTGPLAPLHIGTAPTGYTAPFQLPTLMLVDNTASQGSSIILWDNQQAADLRGFRINSNFIASGDFGIQSLNDAGTIKGTRFYIDPTGSVGIGVTDFSGVSAPGFVLQNERALYGRNAAGTGSTVMLAADINDITRILNSGSIVPIDGVIAVGSNSRIGYLYVHVVEENASAQYELRGTGNTTNEITDSGGIFSGVAGTANSINIYWSVANTRYELENKRGGARLITKELTGR